MKKQVLTVALALALTTSSAFASSCTKQIPKTPAKAVKNAQTTPCCAKESAKQKFEDKFKKDKADFDAKLGLTKDQKAKIDALDEKTKLGLDGLFAKFYTEKAKLFELKSQQACPLKIEEQQVKLKEAKKAIKNYMEQSKKEFESILTDCQLKKLQAMKEEKKKEFAQKCGCKGKCHFHHHGPFDDDIAPFGPDSDDAQPVAPAAKCPCKK